MAGKVASQTMFAILRQMSTTATIFVYHRDQTVGSDQDTSKFNETIMQHYNDVYFTLFLALLQKSHNELYPADE